MALLASPTLPHIHTNTHTRINTCCWCELITHIWFLVSMRFMFPLGHCSNLDSWRIVLALVRVPVRTLLDLWPALKPRTLCAAAAEIYAPSQILYMVCVQTNIYLILYIHMIYINTCGEIRIGWVLCLFIVCTCCTRSLCALAATQID